MMKYDLFKDITDEMLKTYVAKSSDYGDSFSESFADHGLSAGVIRISDKYNRLKKFI